MGQCFIDCVRPKAIWRDLGFGNRILNFKNGYSYGLVTLVVGIRELKVLRSPTTQLLASSFCFFSLYLRKNKTEKQKAINSNQIQHGLLNPLISPNPFPRHLQILLKSFRSSIARCRAQGMQRARKRKNNSPQTSHTKQQEPNLIAP